MKTANLLIVVGLVAVGGIAVYYFFLRPKSGASGVINAGRSFDMGVGSTPPSSTPPNKSKEGEILEGVAGIVEATGGAAAKIFG